MVQSQYSEQRLHSPSGTKQMTCIEIEYVTLPLWQQVSK